MENDGKSDTDSNMSNMSNISTETVPDRFNIHNDHDGHGGDGHGGDGHGGDGRGGDGHGGDGHGGDGHGGDGDHGGDDDDGGDGGHGGDDDDGHGGDDDDGHGEDDIPMDRQSDGHDEYGHDGGSHDGGVQRIVHQDTETFQWESVMKDSIATTTSKVTTSTYPISADVAYVVKQVDSDPPILYEKSADGSLRKIPKQLMAKLYTDGNMEIKLVPIDAPCEERMNISSSNDLDNEWIEYF